MNKVIKSVILAAVTTGATATVGMAATPAEAAGASGPGYLCNVDQNTQAFTGAGNGELSYTIAAGDAIRILAGPYYSPNTGNYYWYGHGNGHQDRYVLADDRYFNCR